MRGQPGSPEEVTASELDLQLEAEAVSGIAPYTPRLLGLLQIDETAAQGVSSHSLILQGVALRIRRCGCLSVHRSAFMLMCENPREKQNTL
jgi:hypothetical protein